MNEPDPTRPDPASPPMGKILVTVFVLAAISAGALAWFQHRFLEGEPDIALEHNPYRPAEVLGKLENARITESSGIAMSRSNPGLKWTHNDSGHSPDLFLIGPRGEDRGTFRIERARNIDWEDIASIEIRGRHFLLVGDIGDNRRRREHYTIYIVEEPKVRDERIRGGRLEPILAFDFVFEDGPRDCESLAYDPITGHIYLIDKPPLHFGGRGPQPPAQLYRLPLPERPPDEPLTARHVADLPPIIPTAMDISPDGQRMIVLTYGDAFEYHRQRKDEPWSEAVKRKPYRVSMPRRRQGEAICYSLDGQALFSTTEGRRSPLWRLQRRAGDEDDDDGEAE